MKKLLFSIIIISVIFASYTLIERNQIVGQNNEVELVYDGKGLDKLMAIAPDFKLTDLKQNGVSSVAVYEQTLQDLLETGRLLKIEPAMLSLLDQLGARISTGSQLISGNGALFMTADQVLKAKFTKIKPLLEEKYQAEITERNGNVYLYFPRWHEALLKIPFGFSEKSIADLIKAGLEVVPRSANHPDSLMLLRDLSSDLATELIIFDGDEITGYPTQIDKTAEILQENGIILGQIEPFIAFQAGSEKLAKLLDYNLVRVHSLQQKEMNQHAEKKIVDRYLRAVRERNVRVLYLKPDLTSNDGNLGAINQQFLKSLKKSLLAEGFSVAKAEPFSVFAGSNLILLITIIGIIAGGILLVNYLSDFAYSRWTIWLALPALVGAVVLLMLGKYILTRQIAALAAAIIFPTIAVLTGLTRERTGIIDLIKNFLIVIGISLLGGLFVASALSHSSFILNIDQFRGVKIAFLLPLLLLIFHYFRVNGSKNIWQQSLTWLESEIKYKHLMLAGLLGLLGIIYIGRTGNFPLLPVPAWELTLRSWLEEILYVRPRFKEFLIGHPFLLLSLWIPKKFRSSILYIPLLLLAGIGQVTVVNTFSHAHTPVLISLLRVIHGSWLGLLLGFVLVVGYQFLVKYILPSLSTGREQ